MAAAQYQTMTDQIASAIRSVLKVAGGYFVARGVTDNSTIEIVISGAVALAGIVWSAMHHKAKAE